MTEAEKALTAILFLADSNVIGKDPKLSDFKKLNVDMNSIADIAREALHPADAPAGEPPPAKPTGCLGDACIHYGVPPILTPCFTCVDGDKAVVKDGASTTSYLHPLFEMLERTGLPPVESEMHDIMACCAKIEEGLREDEPRGEYPKCVNRACQMFGVDGCSEGYDIRGECECSTDRSERPTRTRPAGEPRWPKQPPQPAMDWQDTGVALIAAERKRQIEEEGWTHAGDNDHDDNDLAKAGACYAAGQSFVHFAMDDDSFKHDSIEWPWGLEWYKPEGGRVRELTKAGALIAAEIDRLNRNKQAGTGAKGGTE